ncbi:Uncharacterized protein FWK35_00010775, partial [Aphis craccivora]
CNKYWVFGYFENENKYLWPNSLNVAKNLLKARNVHTKRHLYVKKNNFRVLNIKSCLVCDALDKAFILNVKEHNIVPTAYYSCKSCILEVVLEYMHNIFPRSYEKIIKLLDLINSDLLNLGQYFLSEFFKHSRSLEDIGMEFWKALEF